MAALEKSAMLSSLLSGPIHEGIVEHLPKRAIYNRTVRKCHHRDHLVGFQPR
jgi:hypothetical protein